MSNKVRLHAASHVQNLRQAYALLLLGIICLLAAWLLHPDTRIYPIGVLVLGTGMLIATIINPYRLMAASLLITLAGIATFLTFKNLIPGNQAFPALIIALGLGLTGVALMTRRRFIGSAAITPSLLVLLIGILESLLAANLTPHNFVPFMLSLWLPGIGLFILGLIYLFSSGRV
jgi:hypothetical protein